MPQPTREVGGGAPLATGRVGVRSRAERPLSAGPAIPRQRGNGPAIPSTSRTPAAMARFVRVADTLARRIGRVRVQALSRPAPTGSQIKQPQSAARTARVGHAHLEMSLTGVDPVGLAGGVDGVERCPGGALSLWASCGSIRLWDQG